METTSALVLTLTIVAATGIALANAAIYIGGSSSTVVRVTIDSHDRSLGSILEGPNSSALRQPEPCPDIELGFNTDLKLSVVIDKQVCWDSQDQDVTGNDSSFCPHMNLRGTSATQIHVRAKERRRFSSLSAGNNSHSTGEDHCPGIDVSQSSKIIILIKLTESNDYHPFRGIKLHRKSGLKLDIVVNLGDCPLPSIDMYQVSGSIISIHD